MSSSDVVHLLETIVSLYQV